MDSLKERIEAELSRVFPQRADPSWIEWVADGTVIGAENPAYDMFCEPARDLIQRGGKRWRPRLMLLIAKMLGGQQSLAAAERLVSVVELPHNGSLIIDDIEDGSHWRRGEPAVHVTYGQDLAINAGNLLYFLPTRVIDEAPLDVEAKLHMYQIYAKYLRRVHFGQGLDIVWHRNADLFPTPEEYEQMCRFKTGCLAGMSAEIGAAVAGSDRKLIDRIGSLAEVIGVGFQIQDDIVNLETGNPGKQRGDDIVENKKSLPVILYVLEDQLRKQRLSEVFALAAEQGYERAEKEIVAVIDDIKESGALEKAHDRAKQLLHEASEEIHSIFPASPERKVLLTMLEDFLSA
ncbi:MAG: polyprenyl synthetase family protein [Spirochaetota bacterium]